MGDFPGEDAMKLPSPVTVGNIEWIASSFHDNERNRESMDKSRTWRATNAEFVPGCMFVLRAGGRLYWRCFEMEIGG